MQREAGVPADLHQVTLAPGLQAHQRHPDVQGPEELKENGGSGEGSPRPQGRPAAAGPGTHGVQEKGHLQHAGQQVLQVRVPLGLRLKENDREKEQTWRGDGGGGRTRGACKLTSEWSATSTSSITLVSATTSRLR